MAYVVSKVDVWAAEIQDQPGGLAEKLAGLFARGVNLDFCISRRQPDKPGTGVVFVAPVTGAGPIRAAKNAGFTKAEGLHSLRLEGPDKAGLANRVAGVIAKAGINMRGLSGAALGRKAVFYLAFDSDEDTRKAAQVLKKELDM